MAGLTLEPISLAVGVSAAASAGILALLRRLRQDMRGLRDEMRVAQARILVSEVLLDGGTEALSAALPAVGLLAGAVTAVFPVSVSSQRTRMLVASPPDSKDASVRAAAALLAAVSVSSAEVPEFARAVRSGLAQRGVDLGSLLRRGVTSLPFSTRDKLFERLKRTPFVVVPIRHPAGGAVIGLLLALSRRDGLDRLIFELGRVSSRLALLFPPLRKGPSRAEGSGRRTRGERPPTPRDAEVILWLDADGAVSACEPLQDQWVVDPPPKTLQDLFVGDDVTALLRRASCGEPVALGLARIDPQTVAEVSILRLADADGNSWGYAAFLRRAGLGLHAEDDEASPASSGSSRSASLLP